MRIADLKQLLLPAAVAVLLPAAAWAQTAEGPRQRTLGDLARLCSVPASQDRAAEAMAFCHGYLLGIGDFHAAAFPASSRPGPLFCPPSPQPTLTQVTGSLVAWVEAHPQYAGERAIDGVTRWAQATYPCPTQPSAARGTRPAR